LVLGNEESNNMKIVFLFDQTDESGKVVATEAIPFVTTPDKLNLRQLQPGVSSLGVLFEQKDEKGENQQYFRQIINFPIDLKKPEPPAVVAQGVDAQASPALPPAPAATPAPAASTPTNGAVATEVTKPVKKAKKSAKVTQ
jgi:hypothetical protein